MGITKLHQPLSKKNNGDCTDTRCTPQCSWWLVVIGVIICVVHAKLLLSLARSYRHRWWWHVTVAAAAVALLVALYPGGDADPGEADAG
jgi:glucan phosphoethanolaminetransferase (alkaline phosphatase superfamily)